VWLDSGGKKEYYSSNGTLVVWAAPSAGSHEMHFSYQGLQSSYRFVSEGGGPLDSFLRLFVPALAFLLAIFFLLRASRRAKCTIRFPALAPHEVQSLKVGAAELEEAYAAADRKLGGHRLPMHPEEIGRELAAICRLEGKAEIDEASLLLLLRSLSSQGAFMECEGKFLPRKKAGGFSPEELSCMRLLHDILLEKGIPFRRSRLMKIRKSGLELALFSGKGQALSRMGSCRRVLLFSSSEQLRSFEKSLAEPTEENTRIKIAISSGKLLPMQLSRSALERLLP